MLRELLRLGVYERMRERAAAQTKELAAQIDTDRNMLNGPYAGATRDTAKRASENLLNRFGDEVQGIFTPNESSTAGMLLALQDIGNGMLSAWGSSIGNTGAPAYWAIGVTPAAYCIPG